MATVAKNNPFSVYGSNYVDISITYNGDLDECTISNTIYNKWFQIISDELQSNGTVLHTCIGVKDCQSPSMDDDLFIIDDISIN